MKKLMRTALITMCALAIIAPAFCQGTGSVDYKKILTNYTKAQKAFSELDDRATELQRYLLDQEKEYKKLATPIQKKSFEEQTAKIYAQKREALAKFQVKKEEEINKDVDAAIKSVALDSGLDTVIDNNVIYYGAIDITDKVIKKLNLK